ncbi:carboxyvinyl-carboxyphosphonate phosphorylmutase [Pseudooceanicola sediminis]|uniref:2-methylisocitrate lyase n=1 Tax=Pseudooceanicola sediminis TaxID=2211117 RepID=A0A399IWQ7_9RHOB|nr:isocitrate lyase/phosphoenolpyruvate mutase family protein [Pseudooceanicola sediminis]KAA2312972.1 carboxyvinyl-carboxyphosphonate phosphorylmutase [Puniceibacterium sp. HSS470]RII37628.1 carboxyvinyl-carboxyphosphonate phosphorylmutase [Pseudooceanicola sediminis]|tara:strand:+ start:33220 stop:34080 length:861 start_codon:yes stop_codon:yes gene_type:complete
MTNLKTLLADADRGIVAPGVYDAFTALLAEQAGFDCLYLSGASIAYTRLGRPDIGLVSVSEVIATIELITDRVGLPVIVDGDTGFGNALNVQRTVRGFERAGAQAIQMEDQSFPKRCGHLAGKKLIPAEEMVGKIRAAVDARQSSDFQIIARTDAIAVEDFDAALDRAELYVEAGADVLFIEAPRSLAQMDQIAARFRDRLPLLANMVEGGQTPMGSAQELHARGFRLVIFPGGIARAMLRQGQAYYASLRDNGSNAPFKARMADFDELNRAIGLPEMLENGARYE